MKGVITMNEYQNQNGNFYGYGQPPQAPNYGAPIQPNGQPMPNQGFNAQPQGGYTQPHQNYATQQGNGQPHNQSGYSVPAQGQDQQGNGGQQENVRYTQILCSPPASGKLEDLQMTVFLSVNMEKLFFEKFLSKNGNLCVGINMDLVLGDQLVGQMFGKHMVRSDHVVSVSTVLAGYNAKRFLEKTPHCTKVIAILLKDFTLVPFNRRDGSTGISVQASCDGYQVIHYSSKHKASDVKPCNLPESKPFYIKDKINGAVGGQQNEPPSCSYGSPQNGCTQPQPGNYSAKPGTVPGVLTFSEMDDDDELPF